MASFDLCPTPMALVPREDPPAAMFQLPRRTALKRQRDVDDAAAADGGRGEKKHRPDDAACPPHYEHPFPSTAMSLCHTQRRKSPGVPALTPGHSDESGCDSPDLPLHMSSYPTDTDMQDCMEDDFAMIRSHANSPAAPFTLPERLNPRPQLDPSTGRIPTPIYSNFPPKMAPRGSSDISSMDLEDPITTAVNARRNIDIERGRRMPSPISEDEAAMTPTTVAGSRLSRLQVSGDESMDMDPRPQESEQPRSESKTGRARSGAITGKKKFHMGFREDCSKCQARVPGHNAHFLPL